MTDYRRTYEKAFGITWDRKLYEVHHIDQNRENNDISNLLLIPKELHQRFHSRLSSILPIRDMTISDVIKSSLTMTHNDVGMCFYDLLAVINYLDELGFWVVLKEMRYAKGYLREHMVEGIEILG